MTAWPPHQSPTVSVAILNHRRPHVLPRLLTCISRIDNPAFEIIVVGDQPGPDACDLSDRLTNKVRYRRFDEPNISRARNHAIRAASGQIIAFTDDDALPEPDWLTRLTRPFKDPMVAAVGGVLRHGDGSGFEWQGGEFDLTGHEVPLALGPGTVTRSAERQIRSGRYLSIRGANCAFRRSALMQVGGFDEAIRYYLDETDIAVRLAHSGWSAAIASRAQVRHLKLPNAVRSPGQRPGNFHEIAASKAFFVQRHSGLDTRKVLQDFKARRIAMLDPQMRLGIVRTADRNRVARELDAGIEDGLGRQSTLPLRATSAVDEYRRSDGTPAPATVDRTTIRVA